MTALEDSLTAASDRGLVELVIRVSREDPAGTPVAWQAIAKYRHAPKGPWGVGVRSCPAAAAKAAFAAVLSRPEPEDESIFS